MRKPHDSILKCLGENPQTMEYYNFIQSDQFKEIRTLLEQSNEKITILAPSNEAMKQINSINRLTDLDLKSVLLYHILPGLIPGSSIQSLHFANTLLKIQGKEQGMKWARLSLGQIQVSSGPLPPATIINSDLASLNGLVHVVDRLLIPPSTVTDTLKLANLTHFLEMTTSNDLIVTMDKYSGGTVLAPNNLALEKFVKNYPSILEDLDAIYQLCQAHFAPKQIRYSTRISDNNHSLMTLNGIFEFNRSEQGLLINQIKVQSADLITRFGVLHILEGLLIPGNGFKSNSSNNNNPTSVNSNSDQNSNDNSNGPSNIQSTIQNDIQSNPNNNNEVKLSPVVKHTREAMPIV
ncbi:hypothetical protein K502DRAFT_323141 [Neoconidiobolus thromboides FSU 785]|nr:hypothetical protein K502DRAFT_323141 [Neoconidiobolus thromboides FSU 785]